MEPLLFGLMMLGIPATVLGVTFAIRRSRAQAMLSQAQQDSACRHAEMSLFGDVTCTIEAHNFHVEVITSRTGGKHSRDLWKIKLRDCKFGEEYSTLNLASEGMFSGWRDKLGFKDLQVGDESFDDAYKIGASDEDKTRGVLLVPAVRQAVDRAFAVISPRGQLSLHRDGEFTVTAYRSGGYSYALAKEHAEALAGLARALDDNRREAAKILVPKKVDTSSLSAVGGTSGAPVGFGSRK